MYIVHAPMHANSAAAINHGHTRLVGAGAVPKDGPLQGRQATHS
jgi:hypothetical protein